MSSVSSVLCFQQQTHPVSFLRGFASKDVLTIKLGTADPVILCTAGKRPHLTPKYNEMTEPIRRSSSPVPEPECRSWTAAAGTAGREDYDVEGIPWDWWEALMNPHSSESQLFVPAQVKQCVKLIYKY